MPYELSISLRSPFTVSHSLQTAGKSKFVQVLLHGETSEMFHFSSPTLEVLYPNFISSKSLNSPAHDGVVTKEQNLSYMWKLEMNSDQAADTLDLNFKVEYSWLGSESFKHRPYSYSFSLLNFGTLYFVKSQVEPSSGGTFCRAGHMCRLNIQIETVAKSAEESLMYEVLADQTQWAVCGRTAGILLVTSNRAHQVSLDVMPLISGYLSMPEVKVSRYIKERKVSPETEKHNTLPVEITPDKTTAKRSPSPRLQSPAVSPVHVPLPTIESFARGQVYSHSQGLQVHVLPASNISSVEVTS